MSFGRIGQSSRFGHLGAGGTLAWLLGSSLGTPATIDMYFQKGKYFGRDPTGLTVSRASTGYANDPSGNWISFASNVARITGNGLLVEESRTNLFLNSNAPATQTITVASGSTYTVSVIGTGSLTLSGAMTGTVTQGSPVTASASSTSLTVTTAGITGSFVNAQVELGSWATSPIITAGASATRAADVVSLTSAPAFGSAYSIFAKGTPQAPTAYGTSQIMTSVDDGTTNNEAVLYRNSGNAVIGVFVNKASATQYSQSGAAVSAGTSLKVAASLAAGTQNAALNAVLMTAGTGAGLPTSPNEFRLGSAAGSVQFFNGFLERIAIWSSTAISTANLQAITT